MLATAATSEVPGYRTMSLADVTKISGENEDWLASLRQDRFGRQNLQLDQDTVGSMSIPCKSMDGQGDRPA